MASQLNIKDAVLIERVRSLAALRQEPVTAMLRHLVDAAWKDRDREVEDRLAAMRAFTAQMQAAVPAELRGVSSREIMDSIYDDDQPDGFAR